MGIRLSEHKSFYIRVSESKENIKETLEGLTLLPSDFMLYDNVKSKLFNNSSHRYIFEKKETFYELKADYCVGIDWLGTTGKYIYVEPKINNSNIRSFAQKLDDVEENGTSKISFSDIHYELDYLKMLLQVTSVSESNRQAKDLVQIDWGTKQIPIEQKDDKLTPFLVIRFLQTLKLIVRKGLKKNQFISFTFNFIYTVNFFTTIF